MPPACVVHGDWHTKPLTLSRCRATCPSAARFSSRREAHLCASAARADDVSLAGVRARVVLELQPRYSEASQCCKRRSSNPSGATSLGPARQLQAANRGGGEQYCRPGRGGHGHLQDAVAPVADVRLTPCNETQRESVTQNRGGWREQQCYAERACVWLRGSGFNFHQHR